MARYQASCFSNTIVTKSRWRRIEELIGISDADERIGMSYVFRAYAQFVWDLSPPLMLMDWIKINLEEFLLCSYAKKGLIRPFVKGWLGNREPKENTR